MNGRDFGNRLSEAMIAGGLSKLHFARELQKRKKRRTEGGGPPLRKVDRSALYAFLQGRDVPPVDTLAEMADILGVRLGWLAQGEEPLEPDLPDSPPPLWLVDGHRGPWKRPRVRVRHEARRVFQELFYARSVGFEEAEPTIRLIFQEILARRLSRRRSRGDRGPADPGYRADTARGLYLKCFMDLKADLPPGTSFSSPEFSAAFLGKVPGWLEDEAG